MAAEDCLEVELPPSFAEGSIQELLDRVFPPNDEPQEDIVQRFDLQANPDLPEIHAVLLAVCQEWRDWRCALLVTAGNEDEVGLADPAEVFLRLGGDVPVLSLRLEQRYSALEYAVRHELWGSREELLDWMRSLMVLYFLDKHEAAPPVDSGRAYPSLHRAVEDLRSRGVISIAEGEDAGTRHPGDDGAMAYTITAEGRQFISGLLEETESYIDQYDHYQDTLADPDREAVDFETGRGADLRVEVYIAEELDPVRTVFLLRLYDGTLDSRLRDWMEVMESEEFFDGVLEPVVNRDGADAATRELVLDEGHAWLEERRERERREAADRDLLRRAMGDGQ